MDVILLERVAKLGQLGDVVTVKPGYARNYLLPQGKALRANKANMAHFEAQRADLETRNEERKKEAQAIADKLNGNTYIAVRSAGETGQLYGSVAARDITSTLDEAGFSVSRGMVELQQPIKVIGLHVVTIMLHPEVEAEITMNVARSEDEAVRQAAGEDLTRRDAFDGDDEAEDEISIEDVFENPEDVDLDGDLGGEESAEAEAETEIEEQAENMTMGDEAQSEDEAKS
ncbi:50S ribosomal protein L9 [Pseudahrensia aquimaris]|uniref:Large ribosomal subunit protein bL9 n=1 Tax=Pseudahrensia aquimaris TaxID=744461 RepID=A0ABW3FFJ0_9HYPH